MASTGEPQSAIEINSTTYCIDLLKKLYEDTLKGENTDVKIIFGDFDDENADTVHVHSLILQTESNVFRVWMSTGCWNTQLLKSADGKTKISLPVDDPEEFRCFLKLLYGQKDSIDKDQLHQVVVPAYRIADKYEALTVMKVIRDEYFPLVIRDLNAQNAAEVMTVAQKYDVSQLVDAVVDFVKRNPEILTDSATAEGWSNKMGELVLTQIISMDSYRYADIGDRWLELVRILAPLQVGLSWNEWHLCLWACSWLIFRQRNEIRKLADEATYPPGKRTRYSYDIVPLAVRVLQNIRFRQMTSSDFNSCLKIMQGLLTPHHIRVISLVREGVPLHLKDTTAQEGTEGFIVNTKMRHE